MTANTQVIKYRLNYRRLALGLLWLAAILIACYIYLVYGTIFKAVSRENDLKQLATLESKVIVLEQQYLGLSSKITLERAYALGFHEAEAKTLIVAGETAKLARRPQ